jgi:hypothetical protein
MANDGELQPLRRAPHTAAGPTHLVVVVGATAELDLLAGRWGHHYLRRFTVPQWRCSSGPRGGVGGGPCCRRGNRPPTPNGVTAPVHSAYSSWCFASFSGP